MSASTVNPALTSRRTARPAGRRGREPRPPVENAVFAGFLRRVVAAHGRRVAAGDVEALADLLALAADVDRAAHTAVTGLRAAGYSWGEIAARLGTTRQAVQQRWGS